jgi:hypothetical protein
MSRDISVGTATGWTAEFDFQQGKDLFLYTTKFRPALGPTQPPIQYLPGVVSAGIKVPEDKANHSPPSSIEVKNCKAIPPLPHTPSCCGAQLIKHRDNSTFICRTAQLSTILPIPNVAVQLAVFVIRTGRFWVQL